MLLISKNFLGLQSVRRVRNFNFKKQRKIENNKKEFPLVFMLNVTTFNNYSSVY